MVGNKFKLGDMYLASEGQRQQMNSSSKANHKWIIEIKLQQLRQFLQNVDLKNQNYCLRQLIKKKEKIDQI